MSALAKHIANGLVKVRKAVPPPGKIFRSKKVEARKRAKEHLRRLLKEFRLAKFS